MADVITEQHYSLKFLVRLKKTPAESFQWLEQAYGENVLSPETVLDWHKRFSDSREDVVDNAQEQKGRRKPSFPCGFCEKRLSRKCDVDRHIKVVHNGEKTSASFPCSICPAKFTRNRDVKRHLKKHNGKYICDHCFKGFPTKISIKEHFKLYHNTPNLLFKCEVCFKAYTRKSNLLGHMKYVHVNKQSFTCNVCSKTFSRRGDLNIHRKRVHENIRPFTCGICYKTFSKKSGLKLHLGTIHKERDSVGENSKNCYIEEELNFEERFEQPTLINAG